MKLLYAPASPYSSKVRMAARAVGIKLEEVKVDTSTNPAELVGANPLGKIPTLIADDGRAVFDSRAIMHYLDRVSGGGLYPKKDEKRTEAELLESLCDGITDCLLAIVYEKRMHPPEKVHQPYIDRQWEKVTRGLDYLEAHMPKTGKKLHGGHFSMAGLVGYLMLRFPGEWEDGRVALTEWPALFAKKFEDYQLLRPQA
ncbi:glutathione S-transferase family protein [Allorhizobium taibaishanense]|uniref:Glutathione S-transferase n=1 Tax=Allorhizobium taibaishanense TaxID=887144 RepID=A0A1Q8ZZ54_9HYPH|nr:glutathione S-transferase family protein [Allorhizobium taibaishanense]MBB4007493.1 glutathione S-transferase [Allorhizobium taibaishanense]OLP47557.1 glutathione S-transferase [Allorhizobium taibaishanense]